MKDVSITLVNESCFSFLKELESNSIDLALIDPPYEVSRETNFKSGEAKGKDTDRFRVSMDFGDWDSDFTGLDEVIKELYRVLRKGGTLICFYDIWKISILRRYFDDAKFRQIRFIEWVKTNPVPINSKINYLTNAREIAVVAVKEGKATFHSEYDNGIYRYPICHDRERFHPTQKPLALIEELVIKHARLGRVDYMTVHEGISDKTIEHSCKLAAYSEQDLARLRKTIFAWQRRNHCKKQPERWQFRRSTCYDVDWSFRFEPCDRNDCSLNVKAKNLSNEPEIVITCIEVKSSLNDFSSINGHNLVGNCNYYLMPYEMKHKVIATEIPPEIGVLAYDNGQIRKVKECKYRKISYLEQSWLLYSFTKRTCHRY